jgi:hypothetical protein
MKFEFFTQGYEAIVYPEDTSEKKVYCSLIDLNKVLSEILNEHNKQRLADGHHDFTVSNKNWKLIKELAKG